MKGKKMTTCIAKHVDFFLLFLFVILLMCYKCLYGKIIRKDGFLLVANEE